MPNSVLLVCIPPNESIYFDFGQLLCNLYFLVQGNEPYLVTLLHHSSSIKSSSFCAEVMMGTGGLKHSLKLMCLSLFPSAAHLQRLQNALKRLFYPSQGVHLICCTGIQYELACRRLSIFTKDYS